MEEEEVLASESSSPEAEPAPSNKRKRRDEPSAAGESDASSGAAAAAAAGDEPTELPPGVLSDEVESLVVMGFDRKKSIHWLHVYKDNDDATRLGSAIEWLSDNVDYEPPPILNRAESVKQLQ